MNTIHTYCIIIPIQYYKQRYEDCDKILLSTHILNTLSIAELVNACNPINTKYLAQMSQSNLRYVGIHTVLYDSL